MKFADNTRKALIRRAVCWAFVLGVIGAVVENFHSAPRAVVIHAFHDIGFALLAFWVSRDLVFGLDEPKSDTLPKDKSPGG